MTAPPNADAMLLACEDALRHRRRYQTGDAEVRLFVDDVPHFVPGMGHLEEWWYQVGVLHLLTFDHDLTVYLDAVTGRVQVEQPLMQVARQIPPMDTPIGPGWSGNPRNRERWEKNDGAR